MKTSEKITKARKKNNLTQNQLAELLEVSVETVLEWEGNLSSPETDIIPKLATAINVSCDYLLDEYISEIPEVSMMSSKNYEVDWAELYPILNEYQGTVDNSKYHKAFKEIIKEMMDTYHYTLDNSFLVIEDMMYQVYLDMEEEERQNNYDK